MINVSVSSLEIIIISRRSEMIVVVEKNISFNYFDAFMYKFATVNRASFSNSSFLFVECVSIVTQLS